MALRARQIKVSFFCVPGHSGDAGNETVDRLAGQAVTMDANYGFPPYLPSNRRAEHKKL